jgi:hypothetical protein
MAEHLSRILKIDSSNAAPGFRMRRDRGFHGLSNCDINFYPFRNESQKYGKYKDFKISLKLTESF